MLIIAILIVWFAGTVLWINLWNALEALCKFLKTKPHLKSNHYALLGCVFLYIKEMFIEFYKTFKKTKTKIYDLIDTYSETEEDRETTAFFQKLAKEMSSTN